jgi:HD-GYP domain-containing protein (c-di-GMP phosphodiesterase class II)
MTAFFRVFSLVLGLVGWGADAAVAQDCEPARTILVIHSYAPDYSWTQAQNEGITRAFAAQACAPRVRIEYLDSKFVQTEAYFAELAQILASKYQGAQIDGVITTDNSAFDFVQNYGRGIFGAAPTVSGGLNAFNRTPPRPPVVAALPEIADHVGTLRQAYSQNPTARDVYAIVDTTVTGVAIATEIRDDMKLAKLPLTLHMLENLTLEEIETEVAALPADAIVYLVPFFRDAANQAYAEGEVARRVAAATKAPVYASWASEVQNGVVGGRTITGMRLGEEAAQALTRWLDGAAYAVPLPVHPPYVDLYDDAALKRHHIDESLLPADATILNRPPTLWERHSNILIPAAGVIVVLGALLGLAVQTLRGQRLINTSNARVLAMNREVIETQREVVVTLGEVIEARSLETANHVHRVAAISRFLGGKAGMTAEDLDILEGASPLHDVGKIGIPEEILAKPGKLTPEEFEVIKTHTTIGQRILKNSTRTLMHAACTIAYEHHERWDGKGYPRGLKAEEIHLMARITMLADVYDALLSERCYKPAWPESEALAFILGERGAMFDPALVDVLIDNVAEVRAIREALADDPESRVRFCGPPRAPAQAPTST